MAYHRVFRPMVCLERTRTKTERFNRVILKLKEQLAGWPMGFVGRATGQSRVRSMSGLSRRSRSTAVVAASIGRPGDAFHCSATTRTCSRQRRVRLRPLRVTCPEIHPTSPPCSATTRTCPRQRRVRRRPLRVFGSVVYVIELIVFFFKSCDETNRSILGWSSSAAPS